MARLVVKKIPWWVSHRKQVMVWLPVATLQASTLAGFGYVYHRLSGLEEQARGGLVMNADQQANLLKTIPPLENTLLVSPQTDRLWLPKPEPVALQVALAAPHTQGMMSTGHDFSAISQSSAAPVRHVAVKPVRQKPVVKQHPRLAAIPDPKPSVSVQRVSNALSASARTAAANLARSMTPSVPDAFIAESVSRFQPNAGTVPVGSSVWVYLGELRDYGWYGQKLHIAPDSGLPEVGRAYRTQKIHGFYDAPHGNRSMGGFQQGDKVIVQQVFREDSGDVWAKLFKEVAVGRINY